MNSETPAIAIPEERGLLPEGGAELIRYSIALPVLAVDAPGIRRINRFYAAVRRRFLRELRKKQLPRQTAAHAAALRRNCTYVPPEYRLSCTVTHNDGICLSILRETSVCDSGGIRRVRAADLWDMRTGWPLSPADFFPQGTHVKKSIARLAAVQAGRRCAVEPYLKGLRPRKIRRKIASDGFFIRHGTLTVFFNPGTLAPPASGILEFPLLSMERPSES